jgi:hypothetical protein
MKIRRFFCLTATLLLLCLFLAPDTLFSIGRFVKEAAMLIVMGK